jgi:hypothetical protein
MAVDADPVFYLDNQFILSWFIFRKSLAAILASPRLNKIGMLAGRVHSYPSRKGAMSSIPKTNLFSLMLVTSRQQSYLGVIID